MKKIILPILLFMMFIPYVVNAETCDTDKITIENIAIESKSDNVEELEAATASGKNINLNLSMSEVGDSIEYRFVVKNDSNEDYELDKTSLNLNSDYINYSFETEDNSNIVKAKSTKNVTLRVEYKTEVPEVKFENGTYKDNKTMIVQLSNDNTINVPDTFKNPNTGVQTYILLILILFILSGSLYILLKKKKYAQFMILIIGIAILIPISVYAICKCNIQIESNIVINKENVCGSFSEDSWETISYNIKNNNLRCYHVGDIKEIELDEFGIYEVRIANMSAPEECYYDGFSQTACGFVVEFVDIITNHRMNPNGDYNGKFYSYGWNKDGWKASELRNYLNSEIYNTLPDDLKNVIINTYTISGYGSSDSQNFVSDDKMYLLDCREVYGSSFDGSLNTAINNERQLDYYYNSGVTTNNYTNAIKKKQNVVDNWWLRSAIKYDNYSIYGVSMWGSWDVNYAMSSRGVSPAFRIG